MFRKTLLLPLAMFAVLFYAGTASAETVRLPSSGEPAYSFEVPSGWVVVYDQYGNLRISADDKSCAVLLSMIADPAVDTTPATDVAAEIIKSSGAQPYTRTAPGRIAGLAADAFFSSMVNDKGTNIDFKLEIVKLDSSHFATQAILTTANMSSADTAALEALVDDVRFIGLK